MPFISLIRSYSDGPIHTSWCTFSLRIYKIRGWSSIVEIYLSNRINPLCEYSQMWQNRRMNRRQHFLYSMMIFFFSLFFLLLSGASYILFKIVYAWMLRKTCFGCAFREARVTLISQQHSLFFRSHLMFGKWLAAAVQCSTTVFSFAAEACVIQGNIFWHVGGSMERKSKFGAIFARMPKNGQSP